MTANRCDNLTWVFSLPCIKPYSTATNTKTIIFRITILSLLLVFALSLLLSGCSTTPVLSTKRTSELHEALIGREFVFRTDWYEKYTIYKGEYGHEAILSTPEGKKPSHVQLKRAERPGELQAIAGTLAHISDIKSTQYWLLKVYFSTEKGQQGEISIWQLDKGIHDDIVTAAWLEDQLSHSAIKFLDKADMEIDEIKKALPTPPLQPTLTAAPKRVHTSAPKVASGPVINDLEATASPSPVRHGETLKLILNYSLQSGGSDSVEVTETRNLLYNGKTLPGYPKQRVEHKHSGPQTSIFRQRIPPKANPGTYTYKGEVCIETGCISRLTRFTISQ
ncbi:MAG: hypothetical protein JAY97_14450 [Candidatus Thiodiazotropha sp. 'RUGA']|nr:hypothetical protein [Candidatus Thiodiazotropha sp. 'RUGA']